MIVVWGGNRFIDCVSLLSWENQTILRISGPPLQIDFATPASLTGEHLEIAENRITGATPRHVLEIACSPKAVAVAWKELPLLMAQEIGSDDNQSGERVLLHADLRPLGMNVYDDAAGLHVGDGLISRSAFSHSSAAITLR